MGRKPRFEYPGGIYHLIQRGNNREFIFEEKEDKEFLKEFIKSAIKANYTMKEIGKSISVSDAKSFEI